MEEQVQGAGEFVSVRSEISNALSQLALMYCSEQMGCNDVGVVSNPHVWMKHSCRRWYFFCSEKRRNDAAERNFD